MNYYAQVIEIITSNRTDWFEIVAKIAAKHPKIVVLAAQTAWQKEVKTLVDSGQKIAAIRLYRDVIECSLREAKEAVERMAS